MRYHWRKKMAATILVCSIAFLNAGMAYGAVGNPGSLLYTKGGILKIMTDKTEGRFEEAYVSCRLEVIQNEELEHVLVYNEGTACASIRIRLVSYWADEAGNPVGLTSPQVEADLRDGWVQTSPGIYEYAVLGIGQVTELLQYPVQMKREGELHQVIEVFYQQSLANLKQGL